MILGLSFHLASLVSGAFWLWMCIDCYRRQGGLNQWHYCFLFFPPSTLFYFVTHLNQITRTPGLNVFGLGLKARIKKARQQLRMSETVAARSDLAELYFEAGQYPDCETEYRKVLEADPKYLEALYYIGLCRLKCNDAAGAMEFLAQVMERDKKLRFGKAWLRYTDCLLALGKRAEALDERKKLCRSFPRPLTEFAYAQLLADEGQKPKAREIIQEMLETSEHAPLEDREWLKRGKMLLKQL